MFQSRVAAQFWGECVLTVAYLINRLPSSLLNWDTPYYRIYGKNADYTSLRAFGSLCFASTLPSQRSKFHPRAIPSVFVGYPPGMKAYKLYDIENKKFFISRDVVFHESVFPFHQLTPSTEVINQFPDLVLPRPYGQSNCPWEDDDPTDNPRHRNCVAEPFEHTVLDVSNEENLVEHDTFEISNAGTATEIPVLLPTDINHTHNSCAADIVPNQFSLFNEVPVIGVRRSSRNTTQPTYLKDYHCNLLMNCSVNTRAKFPLQNFLTYDKLSSSYRNFVLHVSSNTEPTNYHEAALHAHW